MRGTHRVCAFVLQAPGIIPAYAGNTNSANPKGFSARDHPRICGEHILRVVRHSSPRGSSPHMRGTQKTTANTHHTSGIIPAYAGNTCSCRRLECHTRDHPRICGEHNLPLHRRQLRQGSSPHMRGTLSKARTPRPELGIIPAYAGNTSLIVTG